MSKEEMKKRWINFLSDIANLPGRIPGLKQKLTKHINEIKEKLDNLPQTNFNLALYHLKKGNLKDARLRFKITNFIEPKLVEIFYYVGLSYFMEGKYDRALKEFKKAEAAGYMHPNLEYLLKALASSKLEDIPSSVVEQYYDFMASNYDEWMECANYKAPFILAEEIEKIVGRGAKFDHVLDLACGTGFGAYAILGKLAKAKIIGVDISKNMIEQAQAGNFQNQPIYTKLYQHDLANLNGLKLDDKFDLVISLLGANYVNNLEQLMADCKKVLKDKAYIIFVMETTDAKDKQLASDKIHFVYNKVDLENIIKDSGLFIVKNEAVDIATNTKGMLYVISNFASNVD